VSSVAAEKKDKKNQLKLAMKNYKAVSFIIIFVAGFFVLKAQQPNDSLAQKLDEYLVSANKFYRFNGSVLIAEKGKIIIRKSYGYKNVATQSLNDSNSIFQIGSITKQFTSAVILKLQEEGKLSVQDKLTKYFPEFKYADKIMLENLLTHTSGIYNYTNDIDDNDSAIVCNPINKQLVLDLMFKHALDFKPGTKFSYDNSGYYLPGLIIEKVTGKSYEQNVRDIIFTPLQMTQSLFDFRDSKDTNIAIGYKKLNEKEQMIAQRWDSTVTFAAGAIFSTTGDMYKWAKAIANKEILSADSWKAILTPHLGNYGYGWWIDTLFGKKYVMNSERLPGFMAWLSYYPDEDATIILLNNEGWYDEGLTNINANLSAILFNKPYELMREHTGIKLSNDILNKYIGRYDFDKKHHAYVTLEHGSLQIEAPQGGLPKSPLFAEDSTNFYLKIIDARIEFVKDASGNITELISHYNGKDEVCKKIK
jgi:CubicO group peptidase (beta-lactamase class C family)